MINFLDNELARMKFNSIDKTANKIKILFFIDSFRIGGMHRQILYLIKHLNRENFEPIMCTSSSNGGLRGEYEKTGCKLLDLGWKKPLDPATVYRLIKILYSQKPDIVFVCEAQNLFYYRIAKLFWLKKTVQIGSFRALTFWKGHLNKRYRSIDNLFSRWLYSSSDSVVVNSFALKDHYSKIININPQNPIKTIHNGSDFNLGKFFCDIDTVTQSWLYPKQNSCSNTQCSYLVINNSLQFEYHWKPFCKILIRIIFFYTAILHLSNILFADSHLQKPERKYYKF